MQALEGLTVIDMTHFLAGPYCGAHLADLGAEVIKIEPPGTGEPIRQIRPFAGGTSLYYNNVNRGKKSLAVNLKKPQGTKIVKELIQKADILIENTRPGVMQRLGLGYEDVCRINPRLIYLSISGYGQTGTCAKKPGFDLIAQAESGSMSITGEKGGRALKTGISLGDILGGMNGLIGILAALYYREHSGEGQHIDISLVDGIVSALESNVLRGVCEDEVPGPTGNDFYYAAPYEMFVSRDGKEFVIACVTERQFRQLRDAMGQEELLSREEFSSIEGRLVHREELHEIVEQWSSAHSMEEIGGLLDERGIPWGQVRNLRQVARDPFICQEREMLVTVEHPLAGKIPVVGNPIKMSKTPPRIGKPAPELGQDSEDILLKLGYSKEQIEKLREQGVVE